MNEPPSHLADTTRELLDRARQPDGTVDPSAWGLEVEEVLLMLARSLDDITDVMLRRRLTTFRQE